MRRTLYPVVAAVVLAWCVPARAAAQDGDVNKILADARAALGGEKKLAAVKTFAATGTSVVVRDNRSMPPGDVETAFELPDKFMKKDVLAAGPVSIGRTSGFNGDTPISIVDQPPAGGGQVFIRMAGPGDPAPGTTATPEQQEQMRKRQLVAARQDYARFALGMLLPSLPTYPLTFTYGGQAESPDGKADIIDVTGEGDFKVRLFIDTATHLPLMLSWMAREPLVMTRTMGPGGGPAPSGGNVIAFGAGGGQGHVNAQALPPEERERVQKQAEQAMKDAEANRKMVEYRLYYGDYREVDGIKVPFRIQRSMAGQPIEELTLDKVRVNGKIDPKKFETK